MTNTVPLLSIAFMAISCIVAFAIPVVLFIYFRRKKGADILPFFVGCGVMFLFALILEALAHQVILGSSFGERILNNTWLYALYGGLMAGLFEETGRLIAFKTVLRGKNGKDSNALMYGAGHGGFEAAVLLGFTMISNIVLSISVNSGYALTATGAASEEVLEQIESAISSLASTPSYMFLMGGVERIFAVMLQISLSVLVWFAAKDRGRLYLYPLAIFIHFFVDAFTVILTKYSVPMLAVEAAIGIMSVLSVLIAKAVWNKNKA